MQSLVYFRGTQNFAVWLDDRTYSTLILVGKIIAQNCIVLLCNTKMHQISRCRRYHVYIWGWRSAAIASRMSRESSLPPPPSTDEICASQSRSKFTKSSSSHPNLKSAIHISSDNAAMPLIFLVDHLYHEFMHILNKRGVFRHRSRKGRATFPIDNMGRMTQILQ